MCPRDLVQRYNIKTIMNDSHENCGCGGVNFNVIPISIDEAVVDRYGKIASQCKEKKLVADSCGCHSADFYNDDDLNELSEETILSAMGNGNPVEISEINPGETVLDLGSGGGIDVFLAANKVGDTGKVIGIDMTPEMVSIAQSNGRKMGINNVIFKLGRIETITELDESIDLLISNCVINLSNNKDLVFNEIFRVLKPGGRFVISDRVTEKNLPEEILKSNEQWTSCVAGADLKSRYLERLHDIGYSNVEILREEFSFPKAEDNDHKKYIKDLTLRAWKPE